MYAHKLSSAELLHTKFKHCLLFSGSIILSYTARFIAMLLPHDLASACAFRFMSRGWWWTYGFVLLKRYDTAANRKSLQRSFHFALHWRNNGLNGVTNQQRLDYLFNYCWGADQRKRQSFASLAFVRGMRRWPADSPHKGPIMRNMFFHFITSWWKAEPSVDK